MCNETLPLWREDALGSLDIAGYKCRATNFARDISDGIVVSQLDMSSLTVEHAVVVSALRAFSVCDKHPRLEVLRAALYYGHAEPRFIGTSTGLAFERMAAMFCGAIGCATLSMFEAAVDLFLPVCSGETATVSLASV